MESYRRADRGLYADWLFQAIVNLGWHPFLRINHQGQYQLPSSSSWKPLVEVVPSQGMSWSGKVTCFKTNPIDCTLLARWDEGYTDPWLILTDLNPDEANVCWYGFRSWIECSYRDVKSDGWQWQRTRLRNPERAERQWLAMAVALLWTITLGGEQEAQSHEKLISDSEQSTSALPLRHLSCFLNGLLTILARLLMGKPITFGRLFPLPFNHPSHSFISDSS
ncbi:MAG: transposase [Cyanobacteria bacterium P01_F01_bin.143]